MREDTADRAGDAVLGVLLRFYKPELVTIVQAKGVTPKDFWRDRQRVVYRAILALHAEGKHVDLLTVRAFLEQHQCFDRAGGEAFLAVCEMSASAAGFKDHAWLVAESGRWDRLMRACGSVQCAIEARDDSALREAEAVLRRDVLPEGGHPKLHVVKEAAA
jgi:replicative DNA helicase